MKAIQGSFDFEILKNSEQIASEVLKHIAPYLSPDMTLTYLRYNKDGKKLCTFVEGILQEYQPTGEALKGLPKIIADAILESHIEMAARIKAENEAYAKNLHAKREVDKFIGDGF